MCENCWFWVRKALEKNREHKSYEAKDKCNKIKYFRLGKSPASIQQTLAE